MQRHKLGAPTKGVVLISFADSNLSAVSVKTQVKYKCPECCYYLERGKISLAFSPVSPDLYFIQVFDVSSGG